MTAFTKAQIPDEITTLEQLGAWCALALQYNYSAIQVREAENTLPEITAQALPILLPDGSQRLVTRVSVPLSKNYTSDTSKKFWEHVQEIGTVELPTLFRKAGT